MRRLLLIASLAAGCSASNGASIKPSPYCTPPDCSVGQMALAALVTPAPSNTNADPSKAIARLDIAALSLDENGFFQVQLSAPVLLTGQVSVGKAGVSANISGAVVANRPSRIPGRPDESYQTQLEVSTGKYVLPVTETLAGETYTLRFLPSDASQVPPQTFQGVAAQVLPGAARTVGFDLVLDDRSTLTQVTGVITDPVGKPIPGLQVQAIDPAMKTVVSTTTLTDAGGKYTLRLSKSVQKLSPPTVLLTATPTMTAAAGTPMLELTVDVSKPDSTNTVTANLQAPPLPTTAQFSYRVTGIAASGAEQPVVGAQVTFLALVSDASSSSVKAVFQAEGQSDADGVVALNLIPGVGQTNRSYDVAVAPPSSSPFQSLAHLSLAVGPTATGGYGGGIQLPLRNVLSGRVIDQSATPVAGVTVQPSPSMVASALGAQSLADVSNVAATATAGDGRFTLPLDPGAYDVGLLPPATMKLPRRWIDRLQIGMDLDVGDVLLPPAALVRGRVLDPQGNALVNADVQVFTLSPSMSTLCPNRNLACLSPARLAAEGTTGSDGGVQMLLPAATAGLPSAL